MKKQLPVLWLLSFLGMPHVLVALELTVSITGNDDNPGTAAQPLATVHTAQHKARLAILAGERRIRVVVRSGTWHLAAPLVFSSNDVPLGGGASWEGEPGAVLSGGYPLREWHSTGLGRWRADVPAEVSVSSLWSEFSPKPAGRWPESGWAHVVGTGPAWRLSPSPPDGQGIMTVLHAWGAGRCLVSATGGIVHPQGSLVWEPVPELTPTAGRPVCIEGLLAPGLDGGWRPVANGIEVGSPEVPRDRNLVVPRLPSVVVIAGTPAVPVRGLRFSGFTLAHAAWPIPAAGVVGVQAGHVIEANEIRAAPAALQVSWVDDVVLEKLTITASEGAGITIGSGGRNIRIHRCRIIDVGATGIMVGARPGPIPSLGAEWSSLDQVPRQVTIERCQVTRAAGRDPGSVGIAVLFSRDTRVIGNVVEDLPYSGISVGFRWDTSASSQRGALIENNHIRRVMQLLTDGGGVYTLGWQPGTRIVGNLIDDVGNKAPVEGAPSGGIFFDNGSKGIVVEGNVLGRILGEPMRFNGCAPSWLLLGENQVLEQEQKILPSGMAEGVGP